MKTQERNSERSGANRRKTIQLALVAAMILLGFGVGPSNVTAGGGAFVRVNQVGYVLGTPMRAYLMASVPETGASFAVRDSGGKNVYASSIGPNLGSWSASFPYVYALDFGPMLERPGTYSITLSGPAPASSPTFRIGTASALYSGPLANALYFYQNERDGPDFIRTPLRTAPGHVNDEHAITYLPPTLDSNDAIVGDLTPLGVTIDASGGWWDAGDYMKFLETTSYTVTMQELGVRDFPELMGSRSAGANFTAEARFGLDWLQKMWNDRTRTLYYQVGIANGNDTIIGDHDIWRLPQVDDTYGGKDPLYRYIRQRPVFRAGPPGSHISPNLAGRDAAALALCYQIFHDSDPAYANRCLLSAEHIFDLADTAPSGNLLTASPYDAYPETEWRDDLELGATELYFAVRSGDLPDGLPHTDAAFYLRQAAHWAHSYIVGPNDAADTLNLYDVSGVAHYELYRALTARHDDNSADSAAPSQAALEVTPGALLADLKKQLDRAVAQSTTDPFGFGFPWNTWDTTSHGAGLAVMASEYDQLSHSQAYAVYGDRWLANILGANAWGTSLIVGDGRTFPHCMQHQVTNIVGSLDGSPPVLKGAVVEGPNSFAATGLVDGMRNCPSDGSDVFAPFNNSTSVYQDNMQAYSNTEPAIDLTASSPLAFARRIAGLRAQPAVGPALARLCSQGGRGRQRNGLLCATLER